MTFKQFLVFMWDIIDKCMSIELTLFEYTFTFWHLFFAGIIIELIIYFLFNRTNKD